MIVVTGAAGFIGSNIVAALNAAGHTQIAICDHFEAGEKWRNLAKSLFADIVPPDALLEWMRRRSDIEAVIHMGAISSTTAQDADLVMATNFRFPLALLDHCTEAQIPFVYASSASVYGDGALGFDDASDPAAIRCLRPLNLYGWSKRQFDFVVADRIARGVAIPPTCVGLRFFNVFGPNEYHKGDMQSIVAKIAGPISRDEPIALFRSHRDEIADGDQKRDFIYVQDAVAASLHLWRAGQTGIFNIGTGLARSFRSLAEATFAAFDKPVRIEYIDMPGNISGKYQYFTEAQVTRLRTAGYIEPFSTLEASIANYTQRYLMQADPYR